MSESLAAYLSAYVPLVTVARSAIIAAILFGLWVALLRTSLRTDARTTIWLSVAIPLVAWYALIWAAAASGVFEPRPGGISSLPIAILLPIVVGLFSLTRSERIAAAVDAATPSWLVGLQVYRVLGGNFVVLWSFGAIPGVFALPAGIGDVLVGILALPAALYLASGTRGGYVAAIAWNVLGIADLVDAVALGILSSAGPLQLLSLDHSNVLTASYPTVMTPAFMVPLELILHGVSLWQLRRRAAQLPYPILASAK